MSSALSSPTLAPVVENSRIYASGGFLRLPGSIAADDLAQLEADALSVRPSGRRNVSVVSDAAEARGGSPDRAFSTAHGGAVHWRIFSAAPYIASLRETCGVACSPAGGGTYSYYGEGDFLGLHRDIATCDLTVITCLRETGATPAGGVLRVYSRHMTEPLSRARAAGRTASTEAYLGRGESLAVLGGFVPHEVTVMQPGQERIVAIMCYAIPL